MQNTVKTALLLGAMSALLLFVGETLGGAQGLVIGFLFAVGTNFLSYWFSDKIVLSMYRAQQVGPESRLYQLVSRLAERAGLPMPKVYIIPDASPNAFATGRNPNHAAVAATEGILNILSDDELAGVLAHELAHVKHRDILTSSVAATLAAAIMMIARFAMFFGGSRNDREGSNPIAMIATLILAPVAAFLIQCAISRSREFEADAGGAAIAGSPRASRYCSALSPREASGLRTTTFEKAARIARRYSSYPAPWKTLTRKACCTPAPPGVSEMFSNAHCPAWYG